MSATDSGISRPQVIGRAAPMCHEEVLIPRKLYKKGSRHNTGSLSHVTTSEQPAESTAWMPENAVYHSSSARVHSFVGYPKSARSKDVKQGSTFQPLQLHTSHLRKSKYPPSLLFHEKQEDQIMVKSSRSKDGKFYTRIEFVSMTAPEQQQQLQTSTSKKEKHVRYLEPLFMDSEGKGKAIDVNPNRGRDYNNVNVVDTAESCGDQKQSYSGRLLSGRIKSGTQKITNEDLLQLAIGKQLDLPGDADNATNAVHGHHHCRKRGRRRYYHVDKHDNTRSIPSKSIAQSNLCDLQIQPSVSSSAIAQFQDNSSDVTVSSSGSTHHNSHSQRRPDRDGMVTLEEGHKNQECVNEIVVNCPTVINSSLLASPHKSQGTTKDSERALSCSIERQTYPQLQKSGHAKGILHFSSRINSHGSRVANRILLNSHSERFHAPSSKQHGRIKLSHSLAEKRRASDGSESSRTGYRITLSGTNTISSSGVLHQVNNDYSRCLSRSRQRRKVQQQKNIFGNSSGKKKAENNSNMMLRAYKKAHQPVKVCLRGTKKKIIDLLETNSSSASSVLDHSCELPELYAE